MQDLPSDCFEAFSCNVWKAAPMQTVSSCGPLKSQSQTCPSDHFQGEIHFCLLQFLLSSFLCFVFQFPLQICCALYNGVTRKLPLTHEQSGICAWERNTLGCFRVKDATGGQNWLLINMMEPNPGSFHIPLVFPYIPWHTHRMVNFSPSCFHLQTS